MWVRHLASARGVLYDYIGVQYAVVGYNLIELGWERGMDLYPCPLDPIYLVIQEYGTLWKGVQRRKRAVRG